MNSPGDKSGRICLHSEKENLCCLDVINVQDKSEPFDNIGQRDRLIGTTKIGTSSIGSRLFGIQKSETA